ncbi:transmembrane transporter [Schizosaccharomyces pombe]|uniref:Uncharacterized MFS-type transporter C757.11c n=1 Tax=Schizosaccharomyces pombe (strain 972 / ATCC 24843) TaxID=284812 RepID=YJ7B_SCHPO|nr:putative transporter [Schizosaccharomyces pombe]O74921.1 RecName: Full=Uncharacterized MFS-type transporter C757.11c [Schizosaccharomyces pombe 972h-]CAA21236.1 membrane transporter (predicted) [Schizosaccharomyces pombe]|eukprot:NP_587686.1 putative transporter [Schizosaccharomyces pombe]
MEQQSNLEKDLSVSSFLDEKEKSGYKQSVRLVSNDPSASPAATHKPPFISAALMLLNNTILCISFTIVVPTSERFVQHLGGGNGLSGVIIGLPTITALVLLYPMLRFSTPKAAKGYTIYRRPYTMSCISCIIGHIMYALADKAKSVALILVSRIFTGVACTMFLYHKRYFTDKALISIKYRTSMGVVNSVMATLGLTAGPFIGGLMAKSSMKSQSDIWNEYTSGNWLMAFIWVGLFLFGFACFREVLSPQTDVKEEVVEEKHVINDVKQDTNSKLGFVGCLVIFVVAFSGFSAYFLLNAYQASVPIYTSMLYNYSSFQAGNFLSLAGIINVPLLLIFSYLTRYLTDRDIILLGCCLNIVCMVIHITIHYTGKEFVQPYFIIYTLVFFGSSIANSPSVSLLTKVLHPKYHLIGNVAVQISISLSDTVGAIFGGAFRSFSPVVFFAVCLILNVMSVLALLIIWKKLKVKLRLA